MLFYLDSHLSITRVGVVATPIVGDIFEEILTLLNVKKDCKNQIEKNIDDLFIILVYQTKIS